MVVRIVASGNQIRGEEIRASLELYKNSVIYQPKEFIIARAYTLDGSQKGAAEQTLMSFLQEVNEAATMKGVLQDPIRGTVGVISADEFYDVVNRLLPIRGKAVLSAYAKEATDALGPLRLVVKVEKLQEDAETP